MKSHAAESFNHATVESRTGVIEGGGLALRDDVHRASSGPTFTVCAIGAARIAVFFVEEELPLPPSQRAAICALRPAWLDAIVFAQVAPASTRERAVIDAEIGSPDDARLTTCAFAAAVVVESHGAFKLVPKSYLVRLGEPVEITMAFDWGSESWHGQAVLRSGS